MSGRINRQAIDAPNAIPTTGGTVQQLVEDYPELAEPLGRTVAWRDGLIDRKDKNFGKRYPGARPNPSLNG